MTTSMIVKFLAILIGSGLGILITSKLFSMAARYLHRTGRHPSYILALALPFLLVSGAVGLHFGRKAKEAETYLHAATDALNARSLQWEMTTDPNDVTLREHMYRCLLENVNPIRIGQLPTRAARIAAVADSEPACLEGMADVEGVVSGDKLRRRGRRMGMGTQGPGEP